ncbi:MAG: epoxide hydrolase [Dehalococcoidia bacterium]|nr:epoxide hydrolase [Dehalococcoidia bacterium]
MSDIMPFRIHVPEAVLDDLRDRLSRTRWPDQINDGDWSYGTDLLYLKSLCDYWQNGFDWRAQEAELNRFPQFTAQIAGLNIHFIHARSKEPDALPLVITHGWPGSITEFVKIIGPLTDPVSHGGDARDAFHVVCPSIPGYGFSEAPREPGMSPEQVARIEAELMSRLDYPRYGAQGGDWGAIISTYMGKTDPQHCIGIHLNMVSATPPAGVLNPMEGLTPRELGYLKETQEYNTSGRGYYHIHSTRPQSIAYALNDSPAGLAGWILEKFRAWSDCRGNIENSFTKDELLTNITLYWVTGTITSSMRLYLEMARAGSGFPPTDIKAPVGGAIFPKDIIKVPRNWAKKSYNLIHWTDMPRGGHFAALEEPELLVADIRDFFRKVR